ncbi:helix-turn-helix transcriptional regulator [uncultured Roseovarius sp.]|uniref:helix-turn-helix transcriptional regulator n=1 Tax=uncultured Roseovarius sp. TaxID=293344 RepID=UPI00261BF28B|nr:helix-turn-helix transcriptional regulator [uncultured Roseovarius sp.]
MRELSINDYQSLTSAIFSAAVDPHRWSDVLAAMSAHVPSACIQIWAQNLRRDEPLIACTHGYDAHWLDLFARHYHTIYLWAPALTSAPAGEVLYAQEMCAEEVLLKSEFYADWVLPQGDLRAGGGGVLAQTGDAICLFGANIPNAMRDRDEDRWINLVRQMMPALNQSWAISQMLASGALERALLAGADKGDPALLVLEQTGRITFRNKMADALILNGQDVRCDMRDKFHFCEPEAENRLQALLRSLRTGPHVGAHFDLPGGRTVRLARFDPDILDGWDLRLFLGMRVPSLLVVISTPDHAEDAGRLSDQLGLTRAEAEIGLALAQGASPTEIAESRSVSIHTIRNQIKSALSKTGSASRTQLVAQIVRIIR